MVECLSGDAVKNSASTDIIELSTGRRVVRSLKKFTNSENVRCLLASSAMYSHNAMDGKACIFVPSRVISMKNDSAQAEKTLDAVSTQFFESQTACSDSVIVRVGPSNGSTSSKTFLVSGFDDGVVCMLNLSKLGKRNLHRRIF